MRFWFDTEFIDDGRSLELISIGLVAEDGRSYYAISSDFDPARCNAWVAANVLPLLAARGAPEWKPRAQIALEIEDFVGHRDLEFWAYCAAYDWVLLAQLYGPLSDRPRGWPLRARDVAELAALQPDVAAPPEPERAHHALEDARWAKQFWELLVARGAEA